MVLNTILQEKQIKSVKKIIGQGGACFGVSCTLCPLNFNGTSYCQMMATDNHDENRVKLAKQFLAKNKIADDIIETPKPIPTVVIETTDDEKAFQEYLKTCDLIPRDILNKSLIPQISDGERDLYLIAKTLPKILKPKQTISKLYIKDIFNDINYKVLGYESIGNSDIRDRLPYFYGETFTCKRLDTIRWSELKEFDIEFIYSLFYLIGLLENIFYESAPGWFFIQPFNFDKLFKTEPFTTKWKAKYDVYGMLLDSKFEIMTSLMNGNMKYHADTHTYEYYYRDVQYEIDKATLYCFQRSADRDIKSELERLTKLCDRSNDESKTYKIPEKVVEDYIDTLPIVIQYMLCSHLKMERFKVMKEKEKIEMDAKRKKYKESNFYKMFNNED